MSKHPLGLFFVFGLIAFVAVLASGAASPRAAEAQEFTRPVNLKSTPVANGILVQWQRGENNLFFCVDTARSLSNLINQTTTWTNWGCGTTGTSLVLSQLTCGTQYFWRVWAAGPGVSAHSAPATFVTQPCPFSAPTNLQSTVIAHDTVRVSWTRGINNVIFCVDTALSQSDLLTKGTTWRNWGCGTRDTSLVLTGLRADTRYFWRVWAAAPGISGHSATRTFTTAPGDFLPPDDLDTEITASNVIFTWDERDPAFWFCVDVAETESDLLNFGSTWRNFDCGDDDETTVVDIDEFECDETYHWRVFAFAGTLQGHSEVETFTRTC